MATVTRTRSYSTGDSLPATYYNADLDEIVAGVNNINNSQVVSSAAIAESKLAFDASTGHDHDGTDSKKILATNLAITGLTAGQVLKVNSGGTAIEGGGAGRGFTWGVSGTLAIGDEQGIKIICPQGMTNNKLWYRTDSGTATIRLQEDTTDIVSGVSVTSTVGSTTSFTTSTITAGQVVTLDITGTSSGSGLWVTLECTQS